MDTVCIFSEPVNHQGNPPPPTELYMPWNFSRLDCVTTATTTGTSTPGYNPVANFATTSDIAFYGSISVGEYIISLILLVGLLLYCVQLIASGLSNIRTKKKYLHYGGGDVEQTEQI